MYVKLFLAKEFDLARADMFIDISHHVSGQAEKQTNNASGDFWCGDDFTTMFMTTLNILSAARMVKDIFWLRWRYKRWWTFMSIDGHEFKKFQSINWCMYCMYNTMDSSKMSWKDFKDLMIFLLSSNFSSPWKPQKSYHTAPPLLGKGGHRRPCRSGRRWMRNPGAAGWGSAHRSCTFSKVHHTMVFLYRLIKKWSEQTRPPKKNQNLPLLFLAGSSRSVFLCFSVTGSRWLGRFWLIFWGCALWSSSSRAPQCFR